MIERGVTPHLTRTELKELGFQLIVCPLAALYAAAKAVTEVLTELKDPETTAAMYDRMLAFDEFGELVGLEAALRGRSPLLLAPPVRSGYGTTFPDITVARDPAPAIGFQGMRVGLVLGAGGVIGGAWLTGGLDALARETGWDPATADYVVGTSAGSMIGSLCASGVPPWFMVAHSGGETFDGLLDSNGRPAAEADRSAGAVFHLEKAPPPIGPGSWKLALKSLSNPRGHTPGAVLSGGCRAASSRPSR